jgi:AAA+ ATPase superfamily predicted ATPase
VTGGVPLYVNYFANAKNVWSGILNQLLKPGEFLYDDPDYILRHEVDDIGSYLTILKIIAEGNHKIGKIASNLGKSENIVRGYLAVLVILDILKYETPITENNSENSKFGLYIINDNYFNFWFKYIYTNKADIEIGRADKVLERIKLNFVDAHVSYVYEDICIQSLYETPSLLWERNGVHFNRIGRWWNRTVEIDIVGLDDETGAMLFGECKFREQPTDLDVLRKLEEKAGEVKWEKSNGSRYFVLFSINGFTQKMKDAAEEREDVLLLV